MLKSLLPICRLIDAVNDRIGRGAYWLVLVAVLISSGNAIVRYSLNTSSNLWLELQWYLFSAVFLLCAGYTLLRNEHIRIDIVLNGLSKRRQIWIDVVGGLLFLMPMCAVLIYLSWPIVVESFIRQEMSTDAGGLIRWPVKLLIPVGFALLLLQGISETIKRLAYLAGVAPDPTEKPEVAVTHTGAGDH